MCVSVDGKGKQGVTNLSKLSDTCQWIPEAEQGLNSEAGVGGGPEAGPEAECVLHVEGGDGDVGRCWEGNTHHCTGDRRTVFR